MCCGRTFVNSAFLTQVFDPHNPYLADDTYSKQMKNFHWLLGAPHEIFLRIDGKMLMNDQKDDIMRDTLVTCFTGVHTLHLPWICCTASSLDWSAARPSLTSKGQPVTPQRPQSKRLLLSQRKLHASPQQTRSALHLGLLNGHHLRGVQPPEPLHLWTAHPLRLFFCQADCKPYTCTWFCGISSRDCMNGQLDVSGTSVRPTSKAQQSQAVLA